jgi:hypothetical protein
MTPHRQGETAVHLLEEGPLGSPQRKVEHNEERTALSVQHWTPCRVQRAHSPIVIAVE